MKITQFDDKYTMRLGQGTTTLVSGTSGGSNSGLGGDVSGSLGNVSVNGLRRSVSLGSNLGTGVAVGDALTIISTAGTPVARFATPSNTGASFGSNATRVSASSFVGASTNSAREDHRHDGIGTITASSSNTLDRGTFNLRPGSNITFGLTDSDGSGGFDTLTINGAAGGGGGSTITTKDEGSTLSSTVTTLDFTGAGVTASGAGATTTINIPGGTSGGTFPLDSYLATSGNTRNDEFDTGPAIAGKWTLVGTTPDTVDVDSSYTDRLYLRRNDTSGALTCYYQNIPSLPCDITLHADASTFATNFARGGGLVLLPATPTTSSKGLYLGFLYNTGTQVSSVLYNPISGTFGGTVFAQSIAAGPNGVWLRITLLAGGTTADLYYSTNGTFWTQAIAATALGFTVANAGIALAPEGQSIDLEFICHAYRVS